jgi:hypothetical protein
MSRPAVTPVHGCLNAVATVSKEVQALLVDSNSPATAPLCTADLPLSWPVQGMPPQMGQLIVTGAVPPGENGEVWPTRFELNKHMAGTSTPTQVGLLEGQATTDPSMPTKDGQPDSQAMSNHSDVMPMPREATQRLTRFTDEVQIKRRLPLIATPPRQRVATRRPLPIRSIWIAT